MRQFIVLGHNAPTTADFSLDALPGAGRLDVLCRCVGTAVFLSHGIREAVRVHLVLADEYTLRFDSDSLRRLYPDERTIAARIRDGLDQREDAIGHQPAEVSPGMELYRFGFETTLDNVAGDSTLTQLHVEGTPLSEASPPSDPVFVLSDHEDFTDSEAALLADRADRRLRVGPKTLHADQTITVAHNWLDTAGDTNH
jgi:tRNA (pseudouridine54-N1)-methyltransferase